MDLDFLHLNYRRRIAALIWARRAIVLGAFVAVFFTFRSGGRFVLVPLVLGGWLLAATLGFMESSLRRQFIREARMPPFLIGKLRAAHPGLSVRDAEPNFSRKKLHDPGKNCWHRHAVALGNNCRAGY